MTTKQNPNVAMLDEDLDQLSGGLFAIIAIAVGRPAATCRLGGQEGEPVIERESSRTKGPAGLTGGEWVSSIK